MLSVTPRTDVFNACRVLFGPDVQVSIGFFRNLEPYKGFFGKISFGVFS